VAVRAYDPHEKKQLENMRPNFTPDNFTTLLDPKHNFRNQQYVKDLSRAMNTKERFPTLFKIKETRNGVKSLT
jgi:hypothetical protein